MRNNVRNSVIMAVSFIGISSAAFAGGLASTVEDPVITPPVAVVPEADLNWSGLYTGGSIGYAFKGDDRVGITPTATGMFLGDAGKLEVAGANLGLHLGYRWQVDNVVFGPELGYQFSSVSDKVNGIVSGNLYETEANVKNILSLRMKAGVLMRPDLLIFGQAGAVSAKVDYTVNGTAADYTSSGYTVGFGAEKKLGSDWSVLAEFEHVGLEGKERLIENISTVATPAHNNIKIGLNYQF